MKRAIATALALLVPQAWAEHHADVPEAVAGCVQCHREEGVPALPGWPHLAGMEQEAIVRILQGHRERLIPDSTMAKVAAGLGDEQIEAAAAYYSGLEPSDPPPFDFGH